MSKATMLMEEERLKSNNTNINAEINKLKEEL